jgi:hypothetical protein
MLMRARETFLMLRIAATGGNNSCWPDIFSAELVRPAAKLRRRKPHSSPEKVSHCPFCNPVCLDVFHFFPPRADNFVVAATLQLARHCFPIAAALRTSAQYLTCEISHANVLVQFLRVQLALPNTMFVTR